MPRVSVVIPAHNRPALLAEAVASLLTQSFTDWEAVVVDDASDPPLQLPIEDPRCRLLRHAGQPQRGAATKTIGVHASRGEIVAFLDDDDAYHANYLERAVDVLDRHPELEVLFMGVEWFGSLARWCQQEYDIAMSKTLAAADGKELEEGIVRFGPKLLAALVKSLPMAFQRPVVRRSALERIGLYQPGCALWDCDWAIRAALKASTALLVQGMYRQRMDGQAYCSRGDRRLEHLIAGVEIWERHWRDALLGRSPCAALGTLREGAARAWFSLAWHHYQQNERRMAIAALARSARIDFGLKDFKLLARLLLPWGHR